MKISTGTFIFPLMVCGSLLLAGTTYAQSAPGSEDGSKIRLEEIIVTARKVEESLQTVPISVSVFSAENLESMSVDTIQDLSRFTPNLIVNNAGANPNHGITFIRGVGEVDQFVTLDPAVGMYVDGVYLGRVQGTIFDLLDVERIEVLRGPQGTLFGRNTIGGAISVVSVAPNADPSAKLVLTYGNDERVEINAAFNAPVIEDKVFVRGSVSKVERDCLGRLASNGDCIGGRDTVAARGAVRWLPTNSVIIDFSADVTDGEDNANAYALLAVNPDAPLAMMHNDMVTSGALGPDAVLYDENLPAANGNPYETDGTFSTEAPLEVEGYSLKFDWQLNDNLNLIGVSAYRELEGSFSFDGDASTADIAGLDAAVDSDQFSLELRLEGSSVKGQLDWIVGTYYFEESSEYSEDLFVPFLGWANGQTVFQDSVSYAVFAHASYNLSEKLRLSGGVRYSYDEKDVLVGITNVLTDPDGVYSISPLTNRKNDWNAFSPKIALDYQVTDSSLLYASISRGFRSGGINGRAATPNEVNSYNAEFVTSYEIGFKSQSFDDRLRVNAAVFYSDYEDRQITIVKPLPSGDVVNLIDNAGEVEISGFELEVKALVGRGLSLEANVGYTDAEYKKLDPAAGLTEDSEYTFTPQRTGSVAAEYSVPVGGGEFTSRVDYSYRSDIEFVPDSTPFTRQESLGLWNARMVYQPTDKDWIVALWGRNLSDEIYRTQSLDFLHLTGYASSGFSVGREYGITVSLGF